jgi:hypothetical protein
MGSQVVGLMDLDFNACLTLLIIGFVFALITVRALLAVVNRGFLLVDYAQEKLYPQGKKPGGKTGLWDIVGGIVQPLLPEIGKAAKSALLGKGGPPQ